MSKQELKVLFNNPHHTTINMIELNILLPSINFLPGPQNKSASLLWQEQCLINQGYKTDTQKCMLH